MYYVAVCDDEAVYRQQLLRMLEESKIQEHCVVSDFSSGDALLDACKARIFDLVFLDIEMPGINGLKTAESIKKQNPDTLIIFISVHESYAFQAFDVRAFQYLVKPINAEKLKKELSLAIEKLCIIRAYYTTPDGELNFPIKNILYIDVQDHTLTIHANENFSFRGKMDDEERRLSVHQFIRCHKSYLVNPMFIREIKDLSIYLHTGECIPISKRKKSFVIQQFHNFVKRYSI